MSATPTLGTSLKVARELKGLTFAAAGEEAGVPPDMIRRLEADQVKFAEPHDLYYLAKVYRISYVELMIKAGHIKYKLAKPEPDDSRESFDM